MNMKKILASAAASIVAVSAMSVAASAAITASFDDGDIAFEEGGIYKIDLQWIDGLEFTDVAGVNAVISFAEGEEVYIGGSVVFTSDAAGWDQTNIDNAGDADVLVESGKAFKVTRAASPFVSDDSYAMIAFQSWGEDYKIESVELLDASGAVLATLDSNGIAAAGASAGTPVDETPSDTTPDTTPTDTTPDTTTPVDTSKPNTDTGVEGVAAVLGVAVVAAGAMVVAKKRK